MFKREIIPSGEEHMHVPFGECPCKPFIRNLKGTIVLWHRAFDHREWWMGVEIMLGIRCKEHIMPIKREGDHPHQHLPEYEPYYEYEHKK